MSSRREMFAKLRTASRSRTRSRSRTSRSVTPAGRALSTAGRQPLASRRSLLMNLALAAPEPPSSVPPTNSQDLWERVDLMDLSDEEAEDLEDDHLGRWVTGVKADAETEAAAAAAAAAAETGEGWQEYPVSMSPVPTALAEGSLADAQRIVSSPQLGTSSVRSVSSFTSVDTDARPSTSGRTMALRPAHKLPVNNGSDLDSDHDDEFDEAPVQVSAIMGVMDRDIPDDQELDVNERAFINDLQREMDAVVDDLSGVSDSWTWETDFESFRGCPEIFSGPTPGPVKEYDSPYEAFVDIWDKDIIEIIVLETNRYAKKTIEEKKANGTLKAGSRMHKWVDTDADEIMVLFGVYMYMGIDPRTSQKEYWHSCSRLNMPLFPQLMSYNRYILLSKFLHFVDNDRESEYIAQQDPENPLSAKLWKIFPVIKQLNSKFSSLYNMERNISIDESLTLFKGRLSWVQAIRTKAARFGIKSYELCESRTGYMNHFQIYTGKNTTDQSNVPPSADLALKSTKVVLELLRALKHRGHCVTMDNFYNCPSLARYLKSLGIDCLGTLRRNRKNVPDEIRGARQSVARGTIVARHSGDVSIVMWKDSKLVTMISTYHDAETYVASKAGRPLVKPVCVRDYNNIMGGVDLKDQKLSMYLLERKRGVKWYMKMFKRLLNVSIHNAFILYTSSLRRRLKPTLSHREFRYELASALDAKHCRLQPIGNEDAGLHMRLRRNVVHIPNYLSGPKGRKRCVVCLRQGKCKMVRSKCATCNEGLCFGDCWHEWHSLTVLKTQGARASRIRVRT